MPEFTAAEIAAMHADQEIGMHCGGAYGVAKRAAMLAAIKKLAKSIAETA